VVLAGNRFFGGNRFFFLAETVFFGGNRFFWGKPFFGGKQVFWRETGFWREREREREKEKRTKGKTSVGINAVGSKSTLEQTRNFLPTITKPRKTELCNTLHYVYLELVVCIHFKLMVMLCCTPSTKNETPL
jgi:hypothetical protein